jgi:dephospho-CoA kinase
MNKMPYLIAVAGHSGVGKTTAINHFENLGFGQRIYLGEEVLKELNLRGLERNSANEQCVRLSLREREGPAVFAVRATSLIESVLVMETNAFIDAVFTIEEAQYLQISFPHCKFVLLGLTASFEIRSQRLASRIERPLTLKEMTLRDDAELSRLNTDSVVSHADCIIQNEATLADLQQTLEQFWKTLTS